MKIGINPSTVNIFVVALTTELTRLPLWSIRLLIPCSRYLLCSSWDMPTCSSRKPIVWAVTVLSFSVTSGTRSANCVNWTEISDKIPANTMMTAIILSMMLKALPILTLSNNFTNGFNNMAKKAEKASGIKINLAVVSTITNKLKPISMIVALSQNGCFFWSVTGWCKNFLDIQFDSSLSIEFNMFKLI